MADTDRSVLVEKKGKTAIVTLNRPDALNSMTFEMKDRLAEAIDDIERDDSIWGVIVTANGRAFSVGTEISEFPSVAEDARLIALRAQGLFSRIENLDKPVIAAVNGFAMGGGFELALACDLCVASAKAKFGFPEVSIGAIPCYGGSLRLTRAVGKAKAKEIIFTGRPLSAADAQALGIVNAVAEGDVLEEAEEFMGAILKNAPRAVAYAKRCINQGAEMGLEYAMQLEQNLVALMVGTHDLTEGTSAFLEKRAPEFTNA